MPFNGRTMTPEQIARIAVQLRAAQRAGDPVAAYRLLKSGSPDDAALIARQAGHRITSTGDRSFWPLLYRQVARAAEAARKSDR